MRIVAPASSANLGPGFDALGLALDLPFLFAVDDADDALLACEPGHPAAVAYRSAGGRSERLNWRSPIPPGRGLGFSGAARAAGALAGRLECGVEEAAARREALEIAVRLEGHADNAAASMLGGFVVSAAGHSLRVPLGVEVEVVVWWPDSETSTGRARAALPSTVPFENAVFNVGRSSLLVAALATGDLDALGAATEDRLHTDVRLAMSPVSGEALASMRDAGVVACWLSGSGPTVAGLVAVGTGEGAGEGDRVARLLPTAGTTRILGVDQRGAQVLG